MGQYIYGIDFGTSNSVLAIADTQSGNIVKVISESSLLYFQNSSSCVVGNKAIESYIEENMKGRLLKSIKTLLPQSSFTFTYIFGKKYTAEDLVSTVLKYLKAQADQAIGADVKVAVIGRPVVFSEDPEKDALAERRLLNAARDAGFEQVSFQYEPIAAGFLYEQSIDKPEIVLIGDFGGGTSDFTLMRLDKTKANNKDRKADILKTGGLHIGGDDFDASIMWHKLVPYFGYGLKYESYGKMLDLPVHIFRTLCEWEQMAFLKEGKIRRSLDSYYIQTQRNEAIQRLITLIDNNLGFSLFQAIERSKIALSERETADILFENTIRINESIQRSDFNDYVQTDITSIEKFLDNLLKEAGIEAGAIDNVFLTGGTSSALPVKEVFQKRFSKDVIHRGDNFRSVAQGLAYSYFY